MDGDAFAVLLEALADLPPIGTWVTDAACRGQGDVFTEYPQRRATAQFVEQTCQGCPVRGACLAFADENRVDGIWAGEWHSPATGRVSTLDSVSGVGRLGEQRPARPPAACGTVPGYRRHIRCREVPCDPCRAANNAQARRAKAAKRAAA